MKFILLGALGLDVLSKVVALGFICEALGVGSPFQRVKMGADQSV